MLISKFDPADAAPGIAALEEQLSITLPRQYRDFLLRYNGGYTPKTRFRINGVSSDLRGFWGFGSAGLAMDHSLAKEWLPKGMFPIARDTFGNDLLICLKGENEGSIYFADHEKGSALTFLTKDLAAFVRACKSEKIPPAAKRSVEERRAALIARGRGDIITPALVAMWQSEIDKYGHMVQEELRINS